MSYLFDFFAFYKSYLTSCVSYGRDEQLFLECYPEAANGTTPLLQKIRTARFVRGESKPRRGKNSKDSPIV